MTSDTLCRAEGTATDGRVDRPVFQPNVDIVVHEDEVLVLADVPGSSPDRIDVTFENGQLTVRAGVAERIDADRRRLMEEYDVGDFERSFRLGDEIDATGITAEYADGVLTLHLPKVRKALARRIEIK